MIVITEKQILGIFKNVLVLTDRLVCDNKTELPFSVIGNYSISEDDSLMPINIPQADVVVPESVAMWQARDFLIEHNLLDNVVAVINSIQDPIAKKRAQSKFEFSNTVRRDDPLLNYVCTSAGFDKATVDQWFVEANAT